MSIFTRLFRLRAFLASNAAIVVSMFAFGDAAMRGRRAGEARSDGEPTSAGGNIIEFGRRKAKPRIRLQSAATHFSPGRPAAGSEIADVDLVRFRSDLDSMLALLSDIGKAVDGDRETSRHFQPAACAEWHFEQGASLAIEADVTDAVRRLSGRR